MYGECWFTGKIYFKHGGSQNATLRDHYSLLQRHHNPHPYYRLLVEFVQLMHARRVVRELCLDAMQPHSQLRVLRVFSLQLLSERLLMLNLCPGRQDKTSVYIHIYVCVLSYNTIVCTTSLHGQDNCLYYFSSWSRHLLYYFSSWPRQLFVLLLFMAKTIVCTTSLHGQDNCLYYFSS